MRALALVAVLVPSLAAADIEPISRDPDDIGPKSPDAALLLSVGGFVGGEVMAAAGAIADAAAWPLVIAGGTLALFGPSFGPWYAGKPFTTGLGVRLAGAAVEVAGVAIAERSAPEDPSEKHLAQGVPVLIGGAALILTGAILDFAEVRRDARAYNRAHHSIGLAPLVAPTPDGHASGLAVVGSF